MKLRLALTSAVLAFAAAPAAHAAEGGTSLPWDTGFQALVSNIQGPVARSAAIGLLVVAGIMWAATEHSVGVKWLIKVICGISIAVGVVDAANTLGLLGALS